jgi:hypothetical protein
MWTLFGVYQAPCKIIGIGVNAMGIRRPVSASLTPWPPRRTPSRLFP